MLFSKPQFSFSSKFASPSSVIKSNSSVFFSSKITYFGQKQHSTVSWRITRLYFFRSNIICFGQTGPIKVEIFEILSARMKIYQFHDIFETINRFFFKFYIILQYHEKITPLYFFSRNFVFHQRSLSKFKFGEIERLQLMGSFFQNNVTFQLKKKRRVISHDTKEWCKVWTKTDW